MTKQLRFTKAEIMAFSEAAAEHGTMFHVLPDRSIIVGVDIKVGKPKPPTPEELLEAWELGNQARGRP